MTDTTWRSPLLPEKFNDAIARLKELAGGSDGRVLAVQHISVEMRASHPTVWEIRYRVPELLLFEGGAHVSTFTVSAAGEVVER